MTLGPLPIARPAPIDLRCGPGMTGPTTGSTAGRPVARPAEVPGSVGAVLTIVGAVPRTPGRDVGRAGPTIEQATHAAPGGPTAHAVLAAGRERAA
jgi:hypothetical protein